MKKLKWCIPFLLFCTKVLAAPSGADLLNACEGALDSGFQSKAGMMCIWYVTPCDCNFGEQKNVPRVCLPEESEHKELAKEVIAGLYDRPELGTETAEMAAGLILSPNYPCSD